VAEIDLGRPVGVGMADLGEDIEHGQVVARYRLEGARDREWRTLSRGTTIGYRRLDRFPSQPVRRVRFHIEDAVAPPRPVRVGLYAGDGSIPSQATKPHQLSSASTPIAEGSHSHILI
jgi:alpha-L-fucosidase